MEILAFIILGIGTYMLINTFISRIKKEKERNKLLLNCNEQIYKITKILEEIVLIEENNIDSLSTLLSSLNTIKNSITECRFSRCMYYEILNYDKINEYNTLYNITHYKDPKQILERRKLIIERYSRHLLNVLHNYKKKLICKY